MSAENDTKNTSSNTSSKTNSNTTGDANRTADVKRNPMNADTAKTVSPGHTEKASQAKPDNAKPPATPTSTPSADPSSTKPPSANSAPNQSEATPPTLTKTSAKTTTETSASPGSNSAPGVSKSAKLNQEKTATTPSKNQTDTDKPSSNKTSSNTTSPNKTSSNTTSPNKAKANTTTQGKKANNNNGKTQAKNNRSNRSSGGSGGKWLALIAILIALLALAAAAYMWWQQQQQQESFAAALSNSNIIAVEQTELSNNLSQQLTALQQRIQALSNARDERQTLVEQQLSGLRQQTSTIEQQLQNNLDIANDQREVLKMAEVISRIHFSVRAAELDHNPQQAYQALKSAQALLFEINAGKYSTELVVIQTIMNQLDQTAKQQDMTGWLGLLNDMNLRSKYLTVLQPDQPNEATALDTPVSASADSEASAQDGTDDAESSSWHDFLPDLPELPNQIDLKPFFYYRDADTAKLSKILPSEAEALKQNLSMHFTVARLYLAQQDKLAMDAALTGAENLLTEWFVPDDNHAYMLDSIQSLRAVSVRPNLKLMVRPLDQVVDDLRDRSREQSLQPTSDITPTPTPTTAAAGASR